MAIFGPESELGIDVLRLLGCVCRHSLTLTEVTPGGFRSLPMYLGPTLLISQQEVKPSFVRLFLASNHRGLRSLGNGGRVVDLYGPKAIFSGNDAATSILGDGVMRVAVTPSQVYLRALSDSVLNEIADRFQPRLLMYRIRNAGKVAKSQIDVSTFSYGMRQIARAVALSFPEDSGLAHDALQSLRPQDEDIRGRRFRDVKCAIVEVLWGMLHHGKSDEAQVDELAKDVNALLRNRGETLAYNPEQIGWSLRSLNIPRHSTSTGRQILLKKDTRDRVHQLARAYDLACSQRGEPDCRDCNQAEAAISK